MPLSILHSDHDEIWVSLSEARARWYELLRLVNEENRRVLLMRHARPLAVLLPVEELEALVERIADLEDQISVYEYRQAREAGSDEPVPWEKLKADLGLV